MLRILFLMVIARRLLVSLNSLIFHQIFSLRNLTFSYLCLLLFLVKQFFIPAFPKKLMECYDMASIILNLGLCSF